MIQSFSVSFLVLYILASKWTLVAVFGEKCGFGGFAVDAKNWRFFVKIGLQIHAKAGIRPEKRPKLTRS